MTEHAAPLAAYGPRVTTHEGRLVTLFGNRALDVAEASGGAFGPEPDSAFRDWSGFIAWLRTLEADSATMDVSAAALGTPVPRPPQIFAIGLNYADHANESKMAVPEHPVVFTKFASSLAGPVVEVALTGDRVDWEAELVVVIGRAGRNVADADAWDHVAGLAVGQDLSDRTVQSRGNPAQFSLGKSFKGYSPVGPIVPVEFLNPALDRDALRVVSRLDRTGEPTRVLQDGTTSDMVFPVSQVIARLSEIVELCPGDLIFTGTPAGVGLGRDPQEFLKPGDTLTTEISGLGSITQRLV